MRFFSIISLLLAYIPMDAQEEPDYRRPYSSAIIEFFDFSNSQQNIVFTSGSIPMSDIGISGAFDAGKRGFRLSPNPVTNEALVLITSNRNSVADLVIFDMEGHEVNHFKANLTAGNNKIILTLSGLPAGQYELFGLVKDDKLGSLRFIKR